MEDVTRKLTEEQLAPSSRNRRPSSEVDRERAETYLKGLTLQERVELVKTLKVSIDAEVKALTEAAADAQNITKNL